MLVRITQDMQAASSGAPAYSLSLRRGVLQSHPVSTRIADGMPAGLLITSRSIGYAAGWSVLWK